MVFTLVCFIRADVLRFSGHNLCLAFDTEVYGVCDKTFCVRSVVESLGDSRVVACADCHSRSQEDAGESPARRGLFSHFTRRRIRITEHRNSCLRAQMKIRKFVTGGERGD